jgi:DNA primase
MKKPTIYEIKDLTRETRFDKFQLEGQMWLLQYGIDANIAAEMDITEGIDGILLPIANETVIVGCQVRRYNKKPKYLTYTEQQYSYISIHNTKPLIIVEDLLSSYKLFIAGYSTLCLLGTKMSDNVKVIAAKHGRVVLWLDDDLAGHAASKQLFKDLGPLCPNLTAIFNHQPKEIDMEILKEMEL